MSNSQFPALVPLFSTVLLQNLWHMFSLQALQDVLNSKKVLKTFSLTERNEDLLHEPLSHIPVWASLHFKLFSNISTYHISITKLEKQFPLQNWLLPWEKPKSYIQHADGIIKTATKVHAITWLNVSTFDRTEMTTI